MPIVGPIYTAMGVSAEHLHRVAAISSGALDSLPHNGYVVTLLEYCGSKSQGRVLAYILVDCSFADSNSSHSHNFIYDIP